MRGARLCCIPETEVSQSCCQRHSQAGCSCLFCPVGPAPSPWSARPDSTLSWPLCVCVRVCRVCVCVGVQMCGCARSVLGERWWWEEGKLSWSTANEAALADLCPWRHCICLLVLSTDLLGTRNLLHPSFPSPVTKAPCEAKHGGGCCERIGRGGGGRGRKAACDRVCVLWQQQCMLTI